MASCTRVEQALQAYLDGEIPQSERVILEQHIEECRVCHASLQSYRRSNAILFESLASVRLTDDMTDYVLSHLPEMEHAAVPVDVAGVNRRVKHPTRWRDRVFRLMPIAAAFLLVGMAAVINNNWPVPDYIDESIGLVASTTGQTYRIDAETQRRDDANLRESAEAGDRFETGAGSSLMLMLMGPSEVRMDQNTRIYVEDERTLSVEQGRVFLDVAKGRQLFRVRTPHGEVTVFGTRFDVQVGADTMRVIVEDGRVQLSSTDGRELFRVLTRDQQGELRRDADAIRVGGVNADRASAWAARIQPETEARELFLTSIAPRYDAEEINAENGWLISTGGKSLESIVLEWEPVNGPGAFTDYVIYVYTPENEPVFRARVNGDVFLDPSLTEIELRNTGQHTRRLNAVFVKAVPTRVADAQSVTFSRVYAVLGQ